MSQLLGISYRFIMAFDTLVPSAINCNVKTYSTKVKPYTILNKTFENAIMCLNMLQSNAITIQQSAHQIHDQLNQNVANTKKFMERTGITEHDLDRLNVIHVSGSKGKGSTCAFTESILRSFGLRTGFFSSPHLTCVTERIRINGEPISRTKFNQYFWKVYDALDQLRETPDDMPAYFKFLTILSFHVFLMEQVHVAIVEVGIGGEYDCTNILRNTKTVGITSLGIEHTNILGNTIEEITWQKAGIIKPATHVYTVPQRIECVSVLQKRAWEKSASLYWTPEFEDYKWPRLPNTDLLNNNKVQRLNASLAIQLSYNWLLHNSPQIKNKKFVTSLKKSTKHLNLTVPNEVILGLEKCIWHGRFQIIQLPKLRVFIDGAHTMESLNVCIDWFKEHVQNKASKKYLLFNATGERDTKKMLQLLHSRFQFDIALFSPNVSRTPLDLKTNPNQNKCLFNADIWNCLENNTDIGTTVINGTNISEQRSEQFKKFSRIFMSITDVFEFIQRNSNNNDSVDLLVTGSIHLVGATLKSIDSLR